MGKKTQVIIEGYHHFRSVKESKDYYRELFNKIGVLNSIKQYDIDNNTDIFNELFILCQRHPEKDEKLFNICDFFIKLNKYKNGLGLWIKRNDNTNMDISWHCCCEGKGKNKDQLFRSSLRHIIEPQIINFRNSVVFQKECILCEKIFNNDIHIDHYPEKFENIVNRFIKEYNIKIPEENTYGQKEGWGCECIFSEKDKYIEELFYKYHQNIGLRKLCRRCNLTNK